MKTWLFIIDDETDQSHVIAYIEMNDGLKSYRRHFADYYPAKNERLYDMAPNFARALKKVCLLFLQSPENSSKLKIKEEFHAPDTIVYKDSRRYNELSFRMYNMELRMEIYL